MIYFCSFLISALLIGYETKKQRKKIGILRIFGLLILILLAAFRNPSVGGDVNFYVIPYFKVACNSTNLQSFFASRISGDYLYDLLNFVVSRFSDKSFWLFFFQETLIVSFIYQGCINYSEKIKPWKSMLIFCFLFYQFTLTTVRQSCALAICFYAFSYVIKAKFDKHAILKSIILSGIAVFFHSSALFNVLLILIMYVIVNKKIDLKKGLLLTTFISLTACLLLKPLIRFFIQLLVLVNPKYASESYSTATEVGASGYSSLILLAILTCIILFLNITRRRKDEYWIMIDTSILYFAIFYIFSFLFISGFTYVARIAYYIQYFWIISIPQVCELFKKDRKNQSTAAFLMGIIVFAFWWYYFIHGGVTLTYPYIFGGY